MLHRFPISFAQPLWLLLLLLLPLAWWLERHSLVLLSRSRRTISLAIRSIIILFLIFALAGIRIRRASDELTVIFAIDRSESVADRDVERSIQTINAALAGKRAKDKAGIVVFGEDALVERSPGPLDKVEKLESAPARGYTDISKAIRLASGLFPEGSQKRIVLFTDGNQNLGNAASEASAAAANEIPIDVVPLNSAAGDEALVESVQVPDKVDKKKPFDVKITIHANFSGKATLRLYKDKNFLGQNEVQLNTGKNVFLFPQQEDDAGFHTYEAMVDTLQDTVRDNNQAGAYTMVYGEPRVLLVGADEDTRFVKEALNLEHVPAEVSPGAPLNAAEAENFDAVFLCNVSAETLSNAQLKLMQGYCGELGGGLAMLGGENSFGLGGYHHTPVEEALPVDMEVKNKKSFPSLGLIILVDKSGSMGGTLPGSGKTKLQLAAEAAVEASKLLTPRDYIGVIGFDSAAKWDCPWQKAENKSEIERNIRSLREGGGTDAIPAFNEAIKVLHGTQLQLKHILFISDGMVQPGDYDSKLAELRSMKVTVTTIGVGDDADQQFMNKVASATGGRFYYTNDPQRVPRIFTKETVMAQRSYMIEEKFTPKVYQQNEISKGIVAFPALNGYVTTQEKDRAEVLLKSHHNDPVLAVWQYRSGKSLAWTSDAKDKWSSDWVGWADFKKFWGQAARWVMRSRKEGVLHPRINIENGTAHISVDAVTEKGEFVNLLNLDANVITPSLDAKKTTLRQTAPGHYEGEMEAREVGTYLTNVSGEKVDAATAGTSVSYPPEYRNLGADNLLLSQIASSTGGRVNPAASGIFKPESQRAINEQDFAHTLLWLALILFLYDIGVRRVYLDEEQRRQVMEFFARLVPRRRHVAAAEAAVETLGSLKARRTQLRTRRRAEADVVATALASTEAPPAPGATTVLEKLESKVGSQPDQSSEKPKPRAAAPLQVQPGATESKPGSPSGEGELFTSRLLEARKKARRRTGGELGEPPKGE